MNQCTTCSKPIDATHTRCERCYTIESYLEEYLFTGVKARQFVREVLTNVSLRIKSRGERKPT